jgi:hypothetical protein
MDEILGTALGIKLDHNFEGRGGKQRREKALSFALRGIISAQPLVFLKLK